MKADKRQDARLTAGEVATFCEQVSMILGSGVPMYEGMEALKSAYHGHRHERMFGAVCDEVLLSSSVYQALKAQTGWPKYMVEMVGVGEMTGRLDQVMAKLGEHYRREEDMRHAIKSAAAYPMVLGVMVAAILLVILTKVMPVFRKVLSGMGMSIADSSTVLMRVGASIGTVVLVIMVLAVLVVGVSFVLLRTKFRGTVMRVSAKLCAPLAVMQAQRSAARVASVMSMLLTGGITIHEALGAIPNVLDDELAKEKIARLDENVQAGLSIGDAIAKMELYDEMTTCLIRTGSAVGLLDTTMDKVARDYEQRAERSLERLASAIEPTLVGILAVVIGAVLLSIMLPMGGIISGLL